MTEEMSFGTVKATLKELGKQTDRITAVEGSGEIITVSIDGGESFADVLESALNYELLHETDYVAQRTRDPVTDELIVQVVSDATIEAGKQAAENIDKYLEMFDPTYGEG